MEDVVNFPKHYRQSKTETIDLIKESMTTEEFHGYLKGACMKYMSRYKYKLSQFTHHITVLLML